MLLYQLINGSALGRLRPLCHSPSLARLPILLPACEVCFVPNEISTAYSIIGLSQPPQRDWELTFQVSLPGISGNLPRSCWGRYGSCRVSYARRLLQGMTAEMWILRVAVETHRRAGSHGLEAGQSSVNSLKPAIMEHQRCLCLAFPTWPLATGIQQSFMFPSYVPIITSQWCSWQYEP